MNICILDIRMEKMWKYTLKRLLLAILTVIIIICITFFAMNAIPGGPFDKEKAPDPAVQAVLEARFNLDKPLGQQFILYLKNMLKGDFGISLKTGRDISKTITESFAISAKLGGIAIICALVPGLMVVLPHRQLQQLLQHPLQLPQRSWHLLRPRSPIPFRIGNLMTN